MEQRPYTTTYTKTKEGLQIGDKVCYIPFKGANIRLWENGRVKAFSRNMDGRIMYVFVVYHCADDWNRFEDYTPARTKVEDLRLGWKADYEDTIKFESI